MHTSAAVNIRSFFSAYTQSVITSSLLILEVGSRVADDNPPNEGNSLRAHCPIGSNVIGLDFEPGFGVDIVLNDPYEFPLPSGSFDIAISSSCFEHSDFFWLTFEEMVRVVRNGGLIFLCAPSSPFLYHPHPVDNWRFQPDAGNALAQWAKRRGYQCDLLESYIQVGGSWHDFCAVFLIGGSDYLSKYENRIIDARTDFVNGYKYPNNTLINSRQFSEDVILLANVIQSANKST
jgi:SAM-dependent methyltransferase